MLPVKPSFQRKLYGEIPPVAATLMNPSVSPKHVTLRTESEATLTIVGDGFTNIQAVVSQPLMLSVMVTQ